MYLNLPTIPRYLTAAAGSLLVTAGITYLMVQLISMDDFTVPESVPSPPITFMEVREDEPVDETIRKPEPPPPVEQEPEVPMQLAQLDNGSVGVDVNIVAPVTSDGINIKHSGLVDGEQIPIVRVAPTYPPNAVSRGIEGYVILSFSITPSGATANPTVIEANPKGVFDRAAIRAVNKFKYKPKVVDGEAQTVHNVQHRVTFELASG